jgi:chromosome segregation ATPase
MKAAIAFFVVISVALGVSLLMRDKKAKEVQKLDEVRIITFSNTVEETKSKLDEKEKLSMYLQDKLNTKSDELSGASNQLGRINAELARTKSEMQAAAEAARAELAKKDAQISQLTTETNQLTLKMDDLTSSIDKLGQQIASTERKLAASELERQFNDLAVLRTQVAKLKEELTVARRLEWLRMGIYGMQDKKGAELLIAKGNQNSKSNNFSLNVELKQDGGASVITNPPTPPAPK